jgi:DNA-binding MarR family transcriptional regulator
MGSALKRAFRQDDILSKVEPRTASVSSQLMHPGRMALFSRSTFRPCSGLRQLASGAGMSAPVAARHLLRMAGAGLVTKVAAGNKAAFVPLGLVEDADVGIFALLSGEKPRRAMRLVVRGASPNQRDLAAKLRTYQQEAEAVLSRLESAGLLERTKRGREVRYAPSARFVAMADAYERRAPAFEARLLVALERDGVAPRRKGRRGCSLKVEVDRGEGRAMVEFQTHPLCEILK